MHQAIPASSLCCVTAVQQNGHEWGEKMSVYMFQHHFPAVKLLTVVFWCFFVCFWSLWPFFVFFLYFQILKVVAIIWLCCCLLQSDVKLISNSQRTVYGNDPRLSFLMKQYTILLIKSWMNLKYLSQIRWSSCFASTHVCSCFVVENFFKNLVMSFVYIFLWYFAFF